jgi:hypothetical protein
MMARGADAVETCINRWHATAIPQTQEKIVLQTRNLLVRTRPKTNRNVQLKVQACVVLSSLVSYSLGLGLFCFDFVSSCLAVFSCVALSCVVFLSCVVLCC